MTQELQVLSPEHMKRLLQLYLNIQEPLKIFGPLPNMPEKYNMYGEASLLGDGTVAVLPIGYIKTILE